MIDCENEVFDKVYTALIASFPKINVTSEPNLSPASFPCASIYEADNQVYNKTQDSGSNENHVKVMFEVYVFSNKKSGRKTECKNIFNVIDETLLFMGFTRTTKQPLEPTDNIYQIIGRYEAVISKNKTVFRR